MIYGNLLAGTIRSDPDANRTYGLYRVSFISDRGTVHYLLGSRIFNGNIAQRNALLGHSGLVSEGALVDGRVNDVAMTVLPDAPIDPATGLPVPTIVVATAGGVSVIRDDGNVWDITNYAQAPATVEFVDIAGTQRIITQSRYTSWSIILDIPTADIPIFTQYFNRDDGSPLIGIASHYASTGDDILVGKSSGLVRVLSEPGIVGRDILFPDLRCDMKSTYNTGWMNGDIKGAFLANTAATPMVGVEVWSNADFSTMDGISTKQTSSLSLSVSDNILTIDVIQSSLNAQDLAFNVGLSEKGRYYFSVEAYADALIDDRIFFSLTPSDGFAGTVVVAQEVDMPIGAWRTISGFVENTSPETLSFITCRLVNPGAGSTIQFRNFTFRPADADRSVNNKGLIVNGTIARSPVADGAELVGYSGFSATGDPATSNFLEQPYNSALDFGTGPFSMIWWERKTIAATRYQLDRRGSTNAGKFTAYSDANGFLSFLAYDNLGTIIAGGTKVSAIAAPINSWVMQSIVRDENGVLRLFTNGKPAGEFSFAGTITNGPADAPLVVGNRWDHMNAWDGMLALLRISATAPTADQIRKIYEDERKLFMPGAQCTLYGTSDAVTALAHDPKTNLLHVGTNQGRSVFDGLLRVANTETPVTTAISAVNGMIAEQ
jgi:hypothetical protein